jgi:4-hydroxy-tetrahydrodipicolinate reductase
MSALAVSLLGTGRMGREIAQAVADQADQFRLCGVWARPTSRVHAERFAGLAANLLSSDLDAVLATADVAIDFTLAEATGEIVAAAIAQKKPLVCGVSGLDPESLTALRDAASVIPVFYARNLSIGVALLERSVATACAVLGTEFRVEIDDLHHRDKRDAPSGTALQLGEAAAAARGQDFSEVMHFPADAQAAAAGHSLIVFRARREGSHAGTHEVRLIGRSETLSFRHEVANRRVFATGALRAAAWLLRQPPGFYGMQDLLAEHDRR